MPEADLSRDRSLIEWRRHGPWCRSTAHSNVVFGDIICLESGRCLPGEPSRWITTIPSCWRLVRRSRLGSLSSVWGLMREQVRSAWRWIWCHERYLKDGTSPHPCVPLSPHQCPCEPVPGGRDDYVGLAHSQVAGRWRLAGVHPRRPRYALMDVCCQSIYRYRPGNGLHRGHGEATEVRTGVWVPSSDILSVAPYTTPSAADSSRINTPIKMKGFPSGTSHQTPTARDRSNLADGRQVDTGLIPGQIDIAKDHVWRWRV